MKKILDRLGVLIGCLTYLFLIITTAQGSGEGLSFSTFGLWAMLAWMVGLAMLKQKANPAILLTYGTGAATITIILIVKDRFFWSSLDSVVVVLTIACIFLWLLSGPRWALVLGVIATIVSSIPFVVITWKFPANSPIVANAGFFVSNALAFIAAKAWTLEDRLPFAANLSMLTLLIVPWLFFA